MLTLNDPIEIDILSVLLNAPQMRMRRNEIKNELIPKYQGKYAEGSFDVILQRRLNKLSWILEQDYVARSSFYSIRKKMKERVEKLIKESQCQSLVPFLNAKWLGPLRNLLIRMKNEDPELALDNFCFTFIGDVPCAFTKSVEAMESHIIFEKSLRERHLHDLERFREDFIHAHMKKDNIGRAQVEKRIKDEVGWTVGEYLKKLLKKAEKEKGVRKIMTVLGITEKMLEEIYKNQAEYKEKG